VRHSLFTDVRTWIGAIPHVRHCSAVVCAKWSRFRPMPARPENSLRHGHRPRAPAHVQGFQRLVAAAQMVQDADDTVQPGVQVCVGSLDLSGWVDESVDMLWARPCFGRLPRVALRPRHKPGPDRRSGTASRRRETADRNAAVSRAQGSPRSSTCVTCPTPGIPHRAAVLPSPAPCPCQRGR
jgi:hypothetical protein